MDLSKAINLVEVCLWFMANFRENLSKLMETLQTSVNEDWRGAKNNVNAFANWLIHSGSWFLIGWNGFSHVWESRFAIVIGWKNFRMSFSCHRLYPKRNKPHFATAIVALRVSARKVERPSTFRNVARQVAYVWHPLCNLKGFLFVIVALQVARKIASCNMALKLLLHDGNGNVAKQKVKWAEQ